MNLDIFETLKNSYGVSNQVLCESEEDIYIEEIKTIGYSVVNDVLAKEKCFELQSKIFELYGRIEKKYGKEYLNRIGEENVLRAPLVYDKDFLDLSLNPKIYNIVKKIVGSYNILHLQNAILNVPNKKHQQRLWHRDMVYQNYTSSVPLGISALFCINDFTKKNGSTEIIPYSHRSADMPSNQYLEKHGVQLEAKTGSVILFDSLLFHRSGINKSKNIRIGINNVYVIALIKQQLSLPSMLNGKYSDDIFLNRFLGYNSATPDSDEEWKKIRNEKL